MSDTTQQPADARTISEAEYKRAVAAICADDFARQMRQVDAAELAKIERKFKEQPKP